MKNGSFKKSKRSNFRTPLTSSFWDSVNTEKPQIIEELKNAIIRHIKRIKRDSDLCRRVIDNFGHRIDVCRKWQPHGIYIVFFFKLQKMLHVPAISLSAWTNSVPKIVNDSSAQVNISVDSSNMANDGILQFLNCLRGFWINTIF